MPRRNPTTIARSGMTSGTGRREHDAQNQKTQSGDAGEHHDRMSEKRFAERTPIREQTEGETARDHQNAPPEHAPSRAWNHAPLTRGMIIAARPMRAAHIFTPRSMK